MSRAFDADALRQAAFARVGAELVLERMSNDNALVRLHIGHLSFGIGQPRNGLEAASVLRTFRDALTDLLSASYAQCRKDEREDAQPVIAALVDALEIARNGLHWYRDNYTDDDSQSDDETLAQIGAAIAKAAGWQA